MNSKWSLDNFNIDFQKTDEGVLIKAEDQSQENFYSKLLNHESLKQLSINQLFDLETLYQLLQDYFEKKPENAFLSISESGNLNYSCQVLFGSVVKKFEFNIPLEKQILDPLAKLEKQLNKISAKIQKLEGENNVPMKAFQDFQKLVFEKLGKLEEILTRTETRVARLEESLPIETLECQFNLTPDLQYKFQVTNEGKTASTLVFTPTSIFAKQSLPKGKKSKFSFLIGKAIWLMMGITTDKPLDRDLAYKHPASFGYSFDGKFYLDSEPQGNYSKYTENDRVSFVCDMGTGKIQVFLNDNFVGHHEISKQNLENNTFYPFVYANRDLGVGATFI